jgi:hypothetical protein
MKKIKFKIGDFAINTRTGKVVKVVNPDAEWTMKRFTKVAVENDKSATDNGLSKYQWVYQSKLKRLNKSTVEQLKEWQ